VKTYWSILLVALSLLEAGIGAYGQTNTASPAPKPAVRRVPAVPPRTSYGAPATFPPVVSVAPNVEAPTNAEPVVSAITNAANADASATPAQAAIPGAPALAPANPPAFGAPSAATPSAPASAGPPGFGAPNNATPAAPAASGPPGFGTPSAAPTAQAAPANATAAGDPDDAMMPPIAIKFPNAPIDQVLKFYAELVGRTILKSPQVTPQMTITLEAQTPLTRAEARQALDTVLSLNGIAMIPVGEKFVSAVLAAQALQEASAFNTVDGKKLPEAAQFITQIVQLTNAMPSEVVPAITPFAKVPGGIVPIDSSQMLVIRDYSINVKRMLEVIRKIDVATDTDYKLEVFPIKYGKVEDIYNVMSGLVGGGGAGASSTRPRTTTGGASSRSRNSSGVSNTSMTRRNTAGTQPGQTGQPASTAQSAFQQRLQQIVSKAAGGDSEILGDAKIIPDDRSNSLVVYATRKDMMTITNIVGKLDVALAQVLIEAIVMEVTLDNTLKYGVSAMQRPQTSGKFSSTGVSDNGGGFLDSLGNLATNSASGSGGGLSYFGKWGNDLDVTVQAIAADSTVNVMSRPRIQTTHAVPAEFFVGDTVPYITGSSYSDYSSGSHSQYSQLEVGITLDVTPYVTPDGLVVMEISQDISQLGTTVKIDGNDVPQTTSRRQSATVSVEDGKTIMLGGYITSQKSNSKSGIPVLKDIPYLGNLFRSNSKTDKRVELIVLLKPTVLQTPKDASLVAEMEKRKLPGVVAAEQDFKKEEQKKLDKTEQKLKKEKK
jgi:general secretion pathway protein D